MRSSGDRGTGSPEAYQWPDYFPENVPPAEAKPAAGRSYRLVNQIPPTPEDFQSTYEDDRARDFGEMFWMACGTSLYTNVQDSIKVRARYKALRKKLVAVGDLSPPMGMMQATPSRAAATHLTVWFCTTATPHESFVAASEGHSA